MLTENLDIVFAMMWIIVVANAMTTGLGLLISPYLARLPSLNPNVMIPLVLSVCFVGAYATRGQIEDVLVAAAFGVLGYFMERYNYSRANFVIGMVLAEMIERNLHISITLYGEDFLLTRPIALIMFLFVILTTAMPFYRNWKRKRATVEATEEQAR
jgi:TctA family transporter